MSLYFRSKVYYIKKQTNTDLKSALKSINKKQFNTIETLRTLAFVQFFHNNIYYNSTYDNC